MNLGLLGFDDATATLARAATRAGDRIGPVADAPADAPLPAGARRVTWEDLLDADSCDAVAVAAGGWHEGRADAVRKLVQAGRTLLLVQPLDLSMLFAWELDMIRRDSGARLVPVLPERLCPPIGRLRGWIADRPGAVESIVLERRLADRSRDAVQRQFCRDADLVRVLVGAPTRLATLGSADGESAWSTLAVGLSSPGHPPARWQAAGPGGPALSVTAVAADGRATLEIDPPDTPGGATRWRWRDADGAEAGEFDGAAAILDDLHAGGQSDGAGDRVRPAGWEDAARGVELAETIPRSLAKGRAVDLHQEEFSEIGTFKGTMASLGCGIVLLALVVVVVATLVAGIARETGWELGERIAGAWPGLVLGAMALFLALQLLPALVGGAREADRAGAPPRGGRRGKP